MTKVFGSVPLIIIAAAFAISASADGSLQTVGVARIDITPDYPIRLSGYGNRTSVSEGVEQRIWAKALAFDAKGDNPAVLITVDNCGVPLHVRIEVVKRLQHSTKLKPDRIAILSSHTHSAPMLKGVLANLFSVDLTETERATIERYTCELTDALVTVATEALANGKPANVSYGIGRSNMAENRRYGGGPTDSDVPVMRVSDAGGKLMAIFANYACHCTAISGKFNRICGDWAGYTQEYLEEEFPGATALIGIGCAGDQRPAKRFGLDFAKVNGREVADRVIDVLERKDLWPIGHPPKCRGAMTNLPFLTPRSRTEWEARARSQTRPTAYHAQKNLKRMDRGEKLESEIAYYVQSWSFGDDLLMVFLPGEVVVDYSVRLKREFDRERTWVNAYANDVPCYIPSERVLREGGYEGESSMRYYDRPNVFAAGVENRVFGALASIIPSQFKSADAKGAMPPPVAATDSTTYFTTKPGHYVQFVASEPQVVDPVAIDFDLRGRLWVAEMNDYPSGLDGNYQPGGRVRLLEDRDKDGRFETATLFLKDIPFPTGITAWGKGALICAAPDILYAEDTTGDGRADVVRKVFSGFVTDNYQARVNSLELGLDNWIYGANGLRGGNINWPAAKKPVTLGSRDFRFSPDFQRFEPASGYTQQGRVRDDWDNWFGCNNSSSLFGYPMEHRYRDRNPHVFLPADRVYVPVGDEPERIYPTSELLTRFNRPSHYNRVTSGCGLGIHRDSVVGGDFYGDAFVCEPVHNVVRRLRLKPDGPVFAGHRAEDEQTSEFLSSRDNWFRPAQVKTGPDGALWVVDMYRSVIEHPRWIPEDRLKELDVRAGAGMGRIYRVLPSGGRLRAMPDLGDADVRTLVNHLDTPNGTLRDLIHRELIIRKDRSAVPALETQFKSAKPPVTRLIALCLLDGLSPDGVSQSVLRAALADADAPVRRHAIRICESAGSGGESELIRRLPLLVEDADRFVRYQLALSLGQISEATAGSFLARLAVKDLGHPWMRAAILSSARDCASVILESVARTQVETPGRSEMLGQLIGIVAATAKPEVVGQMLRHAVSRRQEHWQPGDWATLVALQDALERNRVDIRNYVDSTDAATREAARSIKTAHEFAMVVAMDQSHTTAMRLAAVRLAGRGFNSYERDLPRLAELLRPVHPIELQSKAVKMITRRADAKVPGFLLANWATLAPAVRGGIVTELLRREEWIRVLLDAVEKGTVSPGEIDHVSRLRLARHGNAKIVARAGKLVPMEAPKKRAAVLRQYQSVLTLTGIAANGRAVFERACATCHALNGLGVNVGPDISVYRNKNANDLLVAILDPNSVIEPRYTAYEIETRDDRSLSGIIQSDSTAGVTLVQAQGIRTEIPRGQIASMRASTLSLMPEGLEQVITPQQMADLIAFLKATP